MGPIASVFGYIMDFLFRITSSMGIMNIGLCIILFTIITKLLLFPLTIKQQESSKLMSLMNPEIKAVQNKYKGKTDQASMAKQQVEMQAVYEKYGSNPMAGCLPMAIQLPIIFALYRVIYNIPAYVPSVRVFFDNVANPLMGQPDYINKISELASGVGMAVDKVDYTVANKVVDMLYKLTPAGWDTLESLFPQISSTIAENASKIEQMNYFFGINLATPPFTGFNHITIAWIIPILAGLTQWISTKLISNLQQVDQDAPGASMMNSMMMVLEIMGMVIYTTSWKRDMPSILPASYSVGSMPVIAANRVGLEEVTPCEANGNQKSALKFYGSSFITDGAGEVIQSMDRDSEGVITAEFDLDELESERKSWGLFRDRRPEMYGEN